MSDKPENKKATVSVEIEADVYENIKKANTVIAKAGFSVPTSKLLSVMVNAELGGISPHKLANRFVKTMMASIRGLPLDAASFDDEYDELEGIPTVQPGV